MAGICEGSKWGKAGADLAPHGRGKSPCPLAGAEGLQAPVRALLGAHCHQAEVVVCQVGPVAQLLSTQSWREKACRQGLYLAQLLLCCR